MMLSSHQILIFTLLQTTNRRLTKQQCYTAVVVSSQS